MFNKITTKFTNYSTAPQELATKICHGAFLLMLHLRLPLRAIKAFGRRSRSGFPQGAQISMIGLIVALSGVKSPSSPAGRRFVAPSRTVLASRVGQASKPAGEGRRNRIYDQIMYTRDQLKCFGSARLSRRAKLPLPLCRGFERQRFGLPAPPAA
ncbi:hypothetical protein OU426_00370 [Frigidibacter sp. RF13]|uniref:hypothetical protein n=1 Tax=Frigidibacter sp. RF13 TaxID=2997340 RepID=UPI00226E292D|nr:hypothetical protein [Frigidibacter sp. RF13]MCY1125295.1 hypothetical protein [Frigidibacter sp. RF13]